MGHSVDPRFSDEEYFEHQKRKHQESLLPEDPSDVDERLETGFMMNDDEGLEHSADPLLDPHYFSTRLKNDIRD